MRAATYVIGPNIGLVFIAIVALASSVVAIADAVVWPVCVFSWAGSYNTAPVARGRS